jgi:DNA-binding IclR family transcriptional regulator
MTLTEQIIAALQKSPKGLTSHELAAAIGKRQNSISACAYKMFLAGMVKREPELKARQTMCPTWRYHPTTQG